MRNRFVSSTNAIAYTSEVPPSQIHVYDTLLKIWLLPWEVVLNTRPRSPNSIIVPLSTNK